MFSRQGRRMVNEWRMEWVPDSGRWGPLPPDGVLGVNDLPEAVARIGLLPGDPVFVSPDFTVDADLLDFVRSRDSRGLERETKLRQSLLTGVAVAAAATVAMTMLGSLTLLPTLLGQGWHLDAAI